MFQGTSRFELKRKLGAGGFGIVYEAWDHLRHAPVALKVLNLPDGKALDRFKKEFRSLADLVHPNLVTLYELLSHEDTWFFTMELVSGVNAVEYVRQTPGPASDAPTAATAVVGPGGAAVSTVAAVPAEETPADVGRVRDVLRQVADGLFFLHGHGKLHHDIKPANILVTPEGRAVILDFGLVSDTVSVSENASEVLGTVAYMPPEKANNGVLTPAGDWYSVGIMLHEMLVGPCPYAGNAWSILLTKARDPLAAPGSLVGGVPEDLDRLCQALVARDPQDRPDGAEVLRRLGAPVPVLPSPSPEFVGREAELRTLREAFDRRPAVVGVRGLSGMGKTALVQHFTQGLEGALVLYGKCHEQESVPYKAVDSVIDAVAHHLKRLDDGAVAALLPTDIHSLAQLFPVLESVKAVAEAPLTGAVDPVERRRRAGLALKQLLERLAQLKPFVMVVDDLQWGDVDSADLLGEVLRPPNIPCCLLIYTYRTDELPRSSCLQAFVEKTLRQEGAAIPGGIHEIDVGPLSAVEAEALLSPACPWLGT